MSYTRVPLVNISDDSEDEEIFNKSDGAHFGDLELKLMPTVKTHGKSRNYLPPRYSLYKKFCVIGIVVTITLIISLVVTIKLFTSFGIVYNQTADWQVVLEDSGSESCIHLMDVDNDGRQDILFGTAESVDLNEIMDLSKIGSLEEFCKKKGKKYPCVGKLMALRGYDGKKLWEVGTVSGVLFMNCHGIDVNKDGKTDCIISGRQSTIQAIDVTNNGNILWLGDTKYLVKTWNIYQVAILPDFDEDGVPEVLVCNGGDPNIPAENHDRTAGRLIILSGATGKTLGEHYLEMPEHKESYMSPVIYTWKDGSQYILFGSGGETVPGDLMIMSVPDLYRYVMHKGRNGRVPGVHGNYNHWPKRGRDDIGILTLYKGMYKGIMVPPLILDVNRDGIDDILLSAYEGRLLLFNGKDLQIMWMAEFRNMESYSSPAPGYFDDDDTVDFMMHWSTGSWPYYNRSMTCVVSGDTGKISWSLQTTMYEMSSDLVLKTRQQHRDMFLFRVKGRGNKIFLDANGVKHGVGVQRVIDKRYVTSPAYRFHRSNKAGEDNEQLSEEESYGSHHFLCTDDLEQYKAEIFLMDRTLTNKPIKILEYGTENYTYIPVEHYENQVPSNKSYCVVLQPEDRTTGAVGDVDGDGSIDAVMMTELVGELVDEHYSYDKMKYNLMINKINIQPAIRNKKLGTKIDIDVKIDTSKQEKDISDIVILPKEKQTWTEYMGALHRSWFKVV